MKTFLKTLLILTLLFTFTLSAEQNDKNKFELKLCSQNLLAQSPIDPTCPPSNCWVNGNVVCHGCDQAYRMWIGD